MLLPQSSCTSGLKCIAHTMEQRDEESVDTISSTSRTKSFIEDLRYAVECGAVESSTQGIANAWIQVVVGLVVFNDDPTMILCMRHWCSDGHRPKPDLPVRVANLQSER